MLTFEDVTTRGNYYPDKSMATAAVGRLLKHNLYFTYMHLESTPLPTRHEHDQARTRASRSKDQRIDAARAAEPR